MKLSTNPCKVSASPKDLKDWMIGIEPDYYETEVINGQTCHFEVRFYPNTSFPVKTRIWEFQPHYAGLNDNQSRRFAYKIGWDWNQPQTQKIKSEQFESIKDNFAAWIVGDRYSSLIAFFITIFCMTISMLISWIVFFDIAINVHIPKNNDKAMFSINTVVIKIFK